MKMIPLPQHGDKFWRHGYVVGTIVDDENDANTWPEHLEEDGRTHEAYDYQSKWRVAVLIGNGDNSRMEYNVHVGWMEPGDGKHWGEI